MSWRPERVRQHGKDEAVEEGGETEDWARHLSRALELNFLVSLSIYLSISLSLSPFQSPFLFRIVSLDSRLAFVAKSFPR